jgi:hypothetical protein
MNVLYLIQTHRSLPQIVRLVRAIKQASPRAAVLVSHNRESFAIDPAIFADLADVHVMHVSNIVRFDWSFMQAFLDSVEHARALKIDFDWLVNLTGQCYPARPLAEFEAMLAQATHDGLMEYFEAFTPSPRNPWDYREASNRYHYQYRWRLTTNTLPTPLRKALSVPRRIVNNIQPWFRVDTAYGLKFGVRSPSHPFNAKDKLYGGSFFKTISRRAADYLCAYPRRHPELTEQYRYLNINSEVFPQTVLLNNPAFSFQYDLHHYIKWEQAKLGSPPTLTVRDYDAIVSSGYFFARKFDLDEDSRILDMLDERIFAAPVAAERRLPAHV